MPRYGYARVSSTAQDCALQEVRLRDDGCEVIRAERVSGTSRDGRDELARIMDFLHAGDELVVVTLDRLGRSTRDMLNLVHDLDCDLGGPRSEEHTSELQSHVNLVCRLLLEKKKKQTRDGHTSATVVCS